MRKSLFCVVIPAYNEETVLDSSLSAMKKVINSKKIFLVNDGSTDQTFQIAKSHGINVMNLAKNCGKAKALKKLISSRALTKRFHYIMFSDADSRLSRDFAIHIKHHLKQNPALIMGTVGSQKHGLVSAFRTYEYALSHTIYKQAQNVIHAITCAPGCASLYRGDVLDKLNLSNCTLTEDFDLTIQIHQQKLGSIVYEANAKVITQDPLTVKDYWQQVLRWNTGTWQNIFLHKLYIPNRKFKFELYLMLIDSIIWLGALYFLFTKPILFLEIFALMMASVIALATIVAISSRLFWIIKYAPLFPIFYLINLTTFYYSIFRAIASRKRILAWNKVARYATSG